MLDQVVVTRTLRPRIGHQAPHRVELVVAREDQGLLADGLDALGGGHLPLLDLEVEEAGEDVHQAVAGQHLLPQVGGLVLALRGRRVAGAVAVALVEGQELRVLAGEPRRHPGFVGIDGEVHQRPLLEPEQRLALVALLVLALGVLRALVGERVLQLQGGHRQAVEGDHDIDGERGVGWAEVNLAVD